MRSRNGLSVCRDECIFQVESETLRIPVPLIGPLFFFLAHWHPWSGLSHLYPLLQCTYEYDTYSYKFTILQSPCQGRTPRRLVQEAECPGRLS